MSDVYGNVRDYGLYYRDQTQRLPACQDSYTLLSLVGPGKFTFIDGFEKLNL